MKAESEPLAAKKIPQTSLIMPVRTNQQVSLHTDPRHSGSGLLNMNKQRTYNDQINGESQNVTITSNDSR
jgi:hypothetical protein